MNDDIQENTRRSYLLGDLPDEEITRLELELLTDDEPFEQMWETENRIVDDYVRNRLPQTERNTFESHYLASPVHVERVAFARSLLEAVEATRADPDPASPKITVRLGFLERLGIWPLSWRYAVAAGLLLIAAVTFWLMRDRARIPTELTQIKTERDPQPAVTTEQTAKVQEQKPQLEKVGTEKAREEKHRKKLQSAKILSFSLSPVLVRSSSDQQVLTIPADSQTVNLQLRADPSEKRRFNITIHTVEGEQVWKQSNIKLNFDRTGNGSIIASVPASKLPVGDYILTLAAINPAAPQEEINRYFFRVLRK